MINYKEILRLKALGFNNTRIAEVTGHARSTIILALKRAEAYGVEYTVHFENRAGQAYGGREKSPFSNFSARLHTRCRLLSEG